MFSRKNKSKKRPQRVIKRRARSLLYFFVLSLFFSLTAVTLAIVVTKKPPVISPLPSGVASSVSNIEGKVTQKLEKLGIHTQEVTSSSDQIEIKLSDNRVAIIAPNHDIDNQLASLQVITTRLTMEGKRFSRIDLRFDKPVIRE